MFDQQNIIIFEHPANDHLKLCLRLDYLFNLAHSLLKYPDPANSRICLKTIIDILNLLDRPDLRSKFSKQIHHYVTLLTRLSKDSSIDPEKLRHVIQQFNQQLENIQKNTGRFAPSLRDNAFVRSISHYHHNPGNAADYEATGFYLWLQQPSELRQKNLRHWLNQLNDVQQIIILVLDFIRNSYHLSAKLADKGFFQVGLDLSQPCQLIRVGIPREAQLFPLIALGQHGISIRFMHASTSEDAKQCKQLVHFSLACCNF